ncbi:MAG: acyl-CoA thioesterase [Firmicutes bacterium]|nr:acyl-CoA thioesterase [Bacillota bacterium]
MGAYVSKTYLTVRYAETDMMGIVHHSRYYPWFEIARGDYIKKSGVSYRSLEDMGIMMPLSQSGAKYHGGLKYDDEVMITCVMEKLTVARCRFKYEVYKLPETELKTTGYSEHGFVDAKTFAPINIKKTHPDIWDKIMSLYNGGNE